jgi:hypothetical protein
MHSVKLGESLILDGILKLKTDFPELVLPALRWSPRKFPSFGIAVSGVSTVADSLRSAFKAAEKPGVAIVICKSKTCLMMRNTFIYGEYIFQFLLFFHFLLNIF